jgi:Fe-S cluster assembly ATP-binding protein
MPPKEFRELLRKQMKMLKVDDSFATRYLNDGFSGGEKTRAEILQMAVLKPEIAIMDETDSGLDIDALKIVANGVNALAGPDLGVLVITHYNRILNYIKPNRVHVMIDGRIVTSGGADLALQLEAKGYDWVREEVSSR